MMKEIEWDARTLSKREWERKKERTHACINLKKNAVYLFHRSIVAHCSGLKIFVFKFYELISNRLERATDEKDDTLDVQIRQRRRNLTCRSSH